MPMRVNVRKVYVGMWNVRVAEEYLSEKEVKKTDEKTGDDVVLRQAKQAKFALTHYDAITEQSFAWVEALQNNYH